MLQHEAIKTKAFYAKKSARAEICYSVVPAIKLHGLSSYAQALYHYYIRETNAGRKCWTSNATIAAELSCSERTLRTARGQLIAWLNERYPGLLEFESRPRGTWVVCRGEEDPTVRKTGKRIKGGHARATYPANIAGWGNSPVASEYPYHLPANIAAKSSCLRQEKSHQRASARTSEHTLADDDFVFVAEHKVKLTQVQRALVDQIGEQKLARVLEQTAKALKAGRIQKSLGAYLTACLRQAAQPEPVAEVSSRRVITRKAAQELREIANSGNYTFGLSKDQVYLGNEMFHCEDDTWLHSLSRVAPEIAITLARKHGISLSRSGAGV